MSDPVTMPTTAASTAAGLAGLTLTMTGSIFGLHFDAMLAGFAGALIAQTYVPSAMSRLRAFLQLVAAGGISGYFSPIGVAVATKLAPWPLPLDAMQLAIGAGLGIIAPVLVPLLRKLADRFGDKAP
jgi:hypothetical protein